MSNIIIIRTKLRSLLSGKNWVSRLIKGMSWTILGTFFSKAFMMIAAVAAAKILGVEEYGQYGMINSTVLMFSSFAGLGLAATATKFIAEYKAMDHVRAARIYSMVSLIGLLSGAIMLVLLFLFSDYLANTQLKQPELSILLKISSILLLTNTVNTIQIGILSGFEDFRNIAKFTLINGIIAFLLNILLTNIWGLKGLVFSNVIISVIMFLIYRIGISKNLKSFQIKFRLFGFSKEIKVLWEFSLPSMLSGVMIGPVTWLSNSFIISTSSGYYEMGIFNAANQWRNLLLFIPAAIGNVLLPLIIANKNNSNVERVNILLGWIIVLFISVPILSFPELISVIYGSQYNSNEFKVVISLIALTCCIFSFNDGVGRQIISNNVMWFGLVNNLFWAIIFLLVTYICIPLGAIGLATAYFSSYFLTTLLFIPLFIKRKIVSRELFVSRYISLIWILLIIQVSLIYCEVGFIYRGLLMLIVYFVILKITYDMMVKPIFKKSDMTVI